jgi:hypothetical protein
MQGYFDSGFSSNFNASYKHQQSVGGNNKFSFSWQRQDDSGFSLGESTTQSTELTFNHADPTHGVTADFNLGLNSSNNGTTASSQITATLHEAYDFDLQGSTRNNFNYTLDYTNSTNTNTEGLPNYDTSTVDGQFQLEHVAREYTLGLSANKTLNLDPSSETTGFGTLERLPEILFSTQTINYKSGYFAKLPAELDIGVGRYSEPGHENNSREEDDRLSFLFKLEDITILRGNTEMTTNASFEQRFYSDTAAQYETTNTTRLRQHLGGRSGFDLTYNYAQPEGETPFFFDVFQRVHNITLEGGYLDDNHFQFTLGTGYNFLRDYITAPWQTVSIRTMYRPNPRLRFDTIATYDINEGQWFNITNSVRMRANKNLAIDLVGTYDPQLHNWSEVDNTYEIPLGRTWKIASLLKYNGVLKQFESRNLQIAHEWDCLEASFTYSDNPSSFINERQIYFTLRIKALPFFGTFARGNAGQPLTSGTQGIF